MAEFRGESVFRLRMDGRVRRYLGPDVIGSGLTWGAGVLTGRGMWPQFGHNFTSFSIMVAPDRQITGGQFFNAGEMVANIIELAIPEGSGAGYPELVGLGWPADIAGRWIGTRREVTGAGAIVTETRVEREYSGEAGYAESGFTLTLVDRGSRWSARGTLTGIAKRTGWMLETAGVSGESFVQVLDVLDPQGGNLVSLRRWLRNESLASVEVLRLRPVSP